MNRCFGKFYVQRDLIIDKPHWILEAFQELNILVVDCRANFASDVLEYTALSPEFKELPECLDIPEYKIIARVGLGDDIAECKVVEASAPHPRFEYFFTKVSKDE